MSDEQNVSRRQFLGWGTVSAALSLGIPASVARAALAVQDPAAAAAEAKKAAKDLKPVRIAWIGAGTQGFGQDLKSLAKMPGVEIVAIADIWEPNLKRALELAGPNARGYSDYRKMLERKDIDAVGIATPLYLHAPMSIDAMNAGKHVYCEKMMAYTVEDAKKMVRTADSTKRILQVGHQRRYSVDYHHGLDMVKKGFFGQITHARAQWNRRNNWRRPLPQGADKSMDPHFNWRLYKDRSRGLMAELGSHQIDVANWYLGAMTAAMKNNGKAPEGRTADLHPIAVVGMGGIDYWKDGREVFDNVQVIFEYPGGIKMTYQSIEMNSYDADSETFLGRNGTLIMTEQSGQKSMMFREPGVEEIGFEKASENKTKVGNKTAITLDPGATTKQDKRGSTAGAALAGGGSTAGKTNWHLALEDWVDCIRTGRQPFCDGRIGLADTACVIAANKAMETGTRVKITEDMFHV